MPLGNKPFPQFHRNARVFESLNQVGVTDVLPSDMKVYFLNHEFLRAIPMDRNAAKNLVAARKNSYGYIDRTIYVNIELRIVKLQRPGELKAEALNVTYFSDNLRSRALGPKLVWTPAKAEGAKPYLQRLTVR